MKNTRKKNNDNRWDQRELGATARYACRVSHQDEQAIENALQLSVISIRLQKELIDNLKLLSKNEGIGYQPFIRQILTRYVRDYLQNNHIKSSARRRA